MTSPHNFISIMMVLSVALFSSAGATDLVKIMAPTNPFDKGPKVWCNYLEAFLFDEFKRCGTCLFRNKSTKESCRNSTFKQCVQGILLSLHLYILSAGNNHSFYQIIVQKFCLCKVCKADRCLKDKLILITEPVGTIILREYLNNVQPLFLSSFEDYALKFKDYHERLMHKMVDFPNPGNSLKKKPKLYKFAWWMKMDHRLSTKFAFALINIKHGYQGACSEFHRFVVVSGDKSQGESKFVFCGLLTPFSLFPLGDVVKLSLICLQPSDFSTSNSGSNMCWTTNKVDAQFTLVDHKVVISHPVNMPVTVVQEKILLAEMYHLVSFVISVNMRFNIVFKLLSNAYCTHKIFDGPGSLHDSLKLNEHEYTTKTFQAFLSSVCHRDFMFNHFHNETFLINQIHYKGIEISPAKSFLTEKYFVTIGKQMTHFNLSSFDTHAGTIVEHLVVPKNFKVKITLKTIKFTGYHSPECSFGGIAFLDNVELLSSCENISYGTTFGHDILSTYQELFVVIFWYKILGKITVHFDVQRTLCNKVHLDPCSLQTFCSLSSNTPMLCDQHLTNVSSPSAIFKYHSGRTNFVDRMFTFSTKQKDNTQILFSLQINSSCLVIQVWSKFRSTLNGRTDCHFNLESDNQNMFTTDIEHHIKVSIPSQTYETGYVYYPVNMVDADKIVINNIKECKFTAFMTRGTKCYFTTTRYAGKPLFFTIDIGMPPHYSSSWFDIRLTSKKRTQKKENFPIGTQKICVNNFKIQLGTHLMNSIGNQTEISHAIFFLSLSSKHNGRSDICSVFAEGIGWNKNQQIAQKTQNHLLCFCTTFREVNEASLFFPFKNMDIKPAVPNLFLYIRSIESQKLSGRGILSKKCITVHSHVPSYLCKNNSMVSVRGEKEMNIYVEVFKKNQNISWQQASNICDELDGHLPQLHDTAAVE